MLIWVWVIGWSYFSFRSPLTYNALYVNAIALLCLYARPQGGVVSPFFSVFSPFWVDGKQRTWSVQFFFVKTSAKTFFKELPMIVPGPLVLGAYFLWLQVLVVLGKPRQVAHFEVCDERTYSGLEIMLSYGVVFGVHHLIRPPSRQVEFEYICRSNSFSCFIIVFLNFQTWCSFLCFA